MTVVVGERLTIKYLTLPPFTDDSSRG